MRPARRRGLVVTGAAALALTCATLWEEPDTTLECQLDADCPAGEVCALDQGGVCYKASLPGREFLGLDIRESLLVSNTPTLRVEVRGDDAAVERITNRSPNRYRVSTGNRNGDEFLVPGVRDTILIDVRSIKYLESEQAGELISEPYVGLVTLAQTSRLGQSPSTRGEAGNLPFPPSVDPMTMIAQPLSIAWPHYHPTDTDGDRPLILELRPQGGATTKTGIIHRVLRRNLIPEADTHKITVDTTAECNRLLTGTGAILVKPGEPLENVEAIPIEVTMRFGESLPSPATIQPAPGQLGCLSSTNCPEPSVCIEPGGNEPRFCGCEADDECPTGQVCYTPQSRCVLDLRDYQAYRNTDITTGQSGLFTFDAAVYTHCEGAVDESREIALTVTADPGATSGLPRLNYRLSQNFAAPTAAEDPSPTPLGGKLCLPHWRPPQSVRIPLSGAPAKLHESEAGSYVCCSTDCLANASPGTKPSTCTPEPGVSISGTYELPRPEKEGDPSPWELAGCLPLYVAGVEDPTSIRFTRAPVACKAESCELTLSSGAYDAAGPFVYDLRIEPPVGSIFRSVIVPIEISPETLETPPIVLPPRVLLKGRVALSDDVCTPASMPGEAETCTPSAIVLAERLRIPEEEGQTIPGPYFYSLSTFGDGDFVLPVNPGVYVVTALPAAGAQGGPAGFQVVDLREGSPLIKTQSGVPQAELEAPIVLERGLLVTVELAGFGPNTSAIPLDIGSWEALTFEGEPVDLNATPTCYRASGDPPACQIRRLRPGSSTLLLSQEKFVKFITRR